MRPPPRASARYLRRRLFSQLIFDYHHSFPKAVNCLNVKSSSIPRCRAASFFASKTALATDQPTPPSSNSTPTQSLSESLKSLLTSNAARYVNHSLVQLALRSLQDRTAPVRLAVLTVLENDFVSSFVKSPLLGLGKDGKDWDSFLAQNQVDLNGPVLLRNGPNVSISTTFGSLTTITVPSPLLRSRNIEVLVSRLDLQRRNTEGEETLAEELLQQKLELPSLTDGRSVLISFPVHCALVIGYELGSCLGLGTLFARQSQLPPTDIVKLVLSTPSPVGQLPSLFDHLEITSTNVRPNQSIQESNLEDGGCERHVTAPGAGHESLGYWLEGITDVPGEKPPIAVRNLVRLILDEASTQIAAAEEEALNNRSRAELDTTRGTLQTFVDQWAERSHRELQYQLQNAFISETWSRITWWKLFWRVDDVSNIAAELLQKRWLVNAKEELIFVAGMIEFGTSSREFGKPEFLAVTDEVVESERSESRSSDFEGADTVVRSPSGRKTSQNRPWPLQIQTIKDKLENVTIPPLHKTAQDLMLQTITMSSFSVALSTLIYVSNVSDSIYEAGALTAFGAAYSLRRLQIQWTQARKIWQDKIQEDGRNALKSAEGALHALVDEKYRKNVSISNADEIEGPKATIIKAREALSRLDGEQQPK